MGRGKTKTTVKPTRTPTFTKTVLASTISKVLAGTTALTACGVVTAQELEEIVVTAQRREQSIQEVPYNISAYTGATLENSRVADFASLGSFVPGLALTDVGPAVRGNNNNFILRGINANQTSNGLAFPNQTVAPVSTYLGETPIFFPMQLSDIERVEVLRGPQGTLYGSGALGGTIRVIPKAPDSSELYAELNAEGSVTDDSDEANGSFDAVVNIPIVEGRSAFRASGGYKRLGGFIDHNGLVELGGGTAAGGSLDIPTPSVPGDLSSGFVLRSPVDDVNDSESVYLRAGLALDVTDTFDVQVSYIYQHDEVDNPQVHNPDNNGVFVDNSVVDFPGALHDNANGVVGGQFPNGGTFFPGNDNYDVSQLIDQPYERDVNLIKVDANLELGFATLTSASSYYENDADYLRDITALFNATPGAGSTSLAYYYGFYPRLLAYDEARTEETGFVQEIRLASTTDSQFQYVIGAFYQDLEINFNTEQFNAGVTEFDQSPVGVGFHANPDTFGDLVFTNDRVFDFEDIAVFGEVTYNISDRWQVTGGVRAFWQEFTNTFSQVIPFCGVFCSDDGVNPFGATSLLNTVDVNDQIFKLNTSYDFNDDMKVYFTYAEGFRRGGANGVSTVGPFASLPEIITYTPDKTQNYEVGLKGTLADQYFTAAVFHIRWDNFQFDDFNSAGAVIAVNGGEATSQGVELEMAGRLRDGLTYSFGYTFTDAELSQSFVIEDLVQGIGLPPAALITGNDGDRLPGVPRHSLSLSSDYFHSLGSSSDLSLNWHVNSSYRSAALSNFNDITSAGRNFFESKGFSIWDASVTLASDSKNWYASLFVDNIGNSLGSTGGVPATQWGTRGAISFVTRPRTAGIRFGWKTN